MVKTIPKEMPRQIIRRDAKRKFLYFNAVKDDSLIDVIKKKGVFAIFCQMASQVVSLVEMVFQKEDDRSRLDKRNDSICKFE
jgi:hypothetical protein